MKNIVKRIIALSLVFMFLLGTINSYGYTHDRWDGYGAIHNIVAYLAETH